MRRKIIAAAIAVAAVMGLVSPVGPVAAKAPPTPAVHILGPAVVIGNRAYVSAIYRCNISEHLFVSIKQVGSRKKDVGLEAEGSSALVGATGGGWWIRHPGTDEFTCNGEWQFGRYDIGGADVEYGFGTLEKGKGWLQFCLADVLPSGEEVEEEFHFQWINVIRVN